MTKKSSNDVIPTGTWRLLPSLKPVPVVLDRIWTTYEGLVIYITDKGKYLRSTDVYASRDEALNGAQAKLDAVRRDLDKRAEKLSKNYVALAKFRKMPA